MYKILQTKPIYSFSFRKIKIRTIHRIAEGRHKGLHGLWFFPFTATPSERKEPLGAENREGGAEEGRANFEVTTITQLYELSDGPLPAGAHLTYYFLATVYTKIN